jgi:hypothetical protein
MLRPLPPLKKEAVLDMCFSTIFQNGDQMSGCPTFLLKITYKGTLYSLACSSRSIKSVIQCAGLAVPKVEICSACAVLTALETFFPTKIQGAERLCLGERRANGVYNPFGLLCFCTSLHTCGNSEYPNG